MGSGVELDLLGSGVEFVLLESGVEFVLFDSDAKFVLFSVTTTEGDGLRITDKMTAIMTRVAVLAPMIRGNLLGIWEKEPAPLGDRNGLPG